MNNMVSADVTPNLVGHSTGTVSGAPVLAFRRDAWIPVKESGLDFPAIPRGLQVCKVGARSMFIGPAVGDLEPQGTCMLDDMMFKKISHPRTASVGSLLRPVSWHCGLPPVVFAQV